MSTDVFHRKPEPSTPAEGDGWFILPVASGRNPQPVGPFNFLREAATEAHRVFGLDNPIHFQRIEEGRPVATLEQPFIS
jgi:hypothetical protein